MSRRWGGAGRAAGVAVAGQQAGTGIRSRLGGHKPPSLKHVHGPVGSLALVVAVALPLLLIAVATSLSLIAVALTSLCQHYTIALISGRLTAGYVTACRHYTNA